MAKITAQPRQEKYVVELTSPSGKSIISDQKVENEGNDLGLDPKELLAASLAACTTVTLQMYTNHKGWKIDHLHVNVELDYNKEEGKTIAETTVEVKGDLDEKQIARILSVAKSCPVHKILTQPIEINTTLK